MYKKLYHIISSFFAPNLTLSIFKKYTTFMFRDMYLFIHTSKKAVCAMLFTFKNAYVIGNKQRLNIITYYGTPGNIIVGGSQSKFI